MPMSIDEIKAVVQLKLEELIVLRVSCNREVIFYCPHASYQKLGFQVSDERKTETIKKLTQENEGLCVALVSRNLSIRNQGQQCRIKN